MKLADDHSSHNFPERGDDAIVIVSFLGFVIACFLIKDLRPAATTGFDILISRDQRDDPTARHCSAPVNIGCTTPVLTILTA